MKEIGGYFELEISKGAEYHKNAIRLNTGRNCLEYILKARNYKKIYIPYFTCDVILEPIRKLDIAYEYYSIDYNLNPIFQKKINDDEVFLYTNYFGVKTNTAEELSLIYNNLIIDNSQAFFQKPIGNVDTFYSARKFFGVSDGAYLYTSATLDHELDRDKSYTRFTHLLKRIDCSAKYGYDDFKNNDLSLCNQPIQKMSNLTMSILSGIQYEKVASIRRSNFETLHSILKDINMLKIDFTDYLVPMVYPLFVSRAHLKMELIRNKIYIATYWPNVLDKCVKDDIEYQLSIGILPLPIDQRYEFDDMVKIAKLCL